MSAVPLPDRSVVVFDLDDTLYQERDFVRSGFRAVAELLERETGARIYHRLMELLNAKHADPFAAVISEHRLSYRKRTLIDAYRNHTPTLVLAGTVHQLLSDLRADGHEIGIMTDGRSRTQRNKIRALGLEAWAGAILISEEFGSAKPTERNYRHFELLFPRRQFVYVGNDPTKDFVTANRLGWQTVCVLDSGDQIHPQHFDKAAAAALPQYIVTRLA